MLRYNRRRTAVRCAAYYGTQHGVLRSIARWTSVHSTVDTSPQRVGLESTARWTRVHSALDSSPAMIVHIHGLRKLRKTDEDCRFMRRRCDVLTQRGVLGSGNDCTRVYRENCGRPVKTLGHRDERDAERECGSVRHRSRRGGCDGCDGWLWRGMSWCGGNSVRWPCGLSGPPLSPAV